MEGRNLSDNASGPLSAIWKYRWLVLVITASAVAIGFIFSVLRSRHDVFQATTTLMIQVPSGSVDSPTTPTISPQYVSSQLDVMNSSLVSAAAVEIMTQGGFPMTGEEMIDLVSLDGSSDSPLVTIVAHASSPEKAVLAANAYAEGYRDVTQRQAVTTMGAQLSRIDAQIGAIDDRLSQIDDELGGGGASEALADLRSHADLAVEALPGLLADLPEAEGEEAESLRQEIEDRRQAINLYNEIALYASGDPQQQTLLEEKAGHIERRASLQAQRDEISIRASASPDGIALVQPAVEAHILVGLRPLRVSVVALLIGLCAGTGVAYYLARSRRTFTKRTEPEVVLEAPLLADVPDFHQEGLDSSVPVRDHPRSAAAEAFRFAAAITEAAVREKGTGSLFFVSSTVGHGKTTVAVNLALAAAVSGRSVVVVDCDFGSQEASRLLAGDHHATLRGITDVMDQTVDWRQAIHSVELGNGVGVSLLARGTRPSLASALFQADAMRDLMEQLAGAYDLVVVDGPPLLQVAYSSALAELVENLVVVIEHQSLFSEAVDLKDRTDMIGTPLIGYVYNRSILRREMTMTEGSMMDILGDAGFGATTIPRQSKRG